MKIFRTLLLLAVLLSASLAPGKDMELNTIIGKDYQIFSVDRPRFITRQNAPFFRWTSNEKMEARYPRESNSPVLTYFGIQVQECIFRFQENHLDSIYISVYNRGDAGELSLEALKRAVADLSGKISAELNLPLPPVKKEKLLNKLYIWSRVWRHKGYRYTMKWSFSDQRAEYLQIEISRDVEDAPASSPKLRATELKSNEELRQNVRRDRRGNVYIENIPMVNQGEKGYCVVAVLERVLRYYGADVNQHVFAQLAESSSQQGTSTEALKAVLKKTGGKLGIRVEERFNLFGSARDAERLVAKYNTAAKRARKEQVQMVVRRQGNRQIFDVMATMEKMSPEVYQTSRLTDKSGMRAFFSDIKMHIDRGLPVVWSVLLGIVPEDGIPLQTRGAHMRLITGYNASTNEVIYSDTWGMGHEKKSMPLEDAWAITTLTLFVNPR